jgi:hypothetical protein
MLKPSFRNTKIFPQSPARFVASPEPSMRAAGLKYDARSIRNETSL